MNCKEARELIFTDYLDGQLDAGRKLRVDLHLAHCGQCNELFAGLKKTAMEPFIGLDKPQPPEFIWQKVKETIQAEQEERVSVFAVLWEKVKSAVYIPRPAFVIATVVTMILLFAITFSFKPQGKIEYFAYSTENPAEVFTNNGIGFGTSIEQYFL